MNQLKKSKRGFSLVELMVVVAIMGTLAAIAIPAYNEYRKSAKKTAYRSDMLSLHKGWLAFGVELDSYCERETSPTNATIPNVGMKSLISSKLYGVPAAANCDSTIIGAACTGCSVSGTTCTGTAASCTNATLNGTVCSAAQYIPARSGPGKNNFIGFGAIACGALVAPVADQHFVNNTATDTNCSLAVTTYKLGVFGHISGNNYIGFEVDNNGVVAESAEVAAAGFAATCI